MKPEKNNPELAAWLAGQGHSPKEVQQMLKRLEQRASKTVFEAHFGRGESPGEEVESLVYSVRDELRDESKRELLRYLIRQKLPAADILGVLRQIHVYRASLARGRVSFLAHSSSLRPEQAGSESDPGFRRALCMSSAVLVVTLQRMARDKVYKLSYS